MLRIALLGSLCVSTVLAQSDICQWRGIMPLSTNRAKVESILGAPTFGTGHILGYDTHDERITVWYGGAKPAKISPCLWTVPDDIVINFIVASKHKLTVPELKLDMTRFKKIKDREIEGVLYYFDELDGIAVEASIVEGDEVVGSVSYEPSLKDRKKYCQDPKQ